jgi:hypothetical protein
MCSKQLVDNKNLTRTSILVSTCLVLSDTRLSPMQWSSNFLHHFPMIVVTSLPGSGVYCLEKDDTLKMFPRTACI